MPGERVLVAQPIPSGGGRVISSPFQFFCDGTESLRIEGWNTASGARLQVTYRFAKFDGALVTERHELTLTANRAVATLSVALGQGYLVNLAVFVIGANPLMGQTFTCIKLIRGVGAAAIVVGLLLQGYLGSEQGLGWPGSPIDDSISGGGYVRSITGSAPAAGGNILETVPTGARWQLLTFAATLTTSAVAGARRALIQADNGTTIYAGSWQVNTVAAGTAARWTWQVGLPLETTLGGNSQMAGWVTDFPLLAGHRLSTFATNMDAADQWGAPILTVREWLEINA